MSVELHYEALGGIARRLQACELSAVEPTRTILDRIERRDGRLKSFATVVPEHADSPASSRHRVSPAAPASFPLAESLDHVGPMCRSALDAALGGHPLPTLPAA
ncbi:hypothetical protein [Reyranella sp.]|uniref:hypothetical protein n=1 Tax=Reyranella sp. TaxID=1929291 RepID=UPI0037845A52